MNLSFDTIKQILTLTQNVLINNLDYIEKNEENEDEDIFEYLYLDDKYDMFVFGIDPENDYDSELLLILNYKNYQVPNRRNDRGILYPSHMVCLVNIDYLKNNNNLHSLIKQFAKIIYIFLETMHIKNKLSKDDIDIYNNIYNDLSNLKIIYENIIDNTYYMLNIRTAYLSNHHNESYDEIIKKYEEFIEKLANEISEYKCKTIKSAENEIE